MKIFFGLLVTLLFFPLAANAMDCTSDKAIVQAKAAFANGFVSPDSIHLEHVTEGTFGAMSVCEGILDMAGIGQIMVWINNDDGSITEIRQDDQGNVTTTTLGPNIPNQLQTMENMGNQMSQQFEQGEAEQKKQQDQQAFDQAEQEYAQKEPECSQVEKHPVGSTLLGILAGNGINDTLKGTSTLAQCQKMESRYNQMLQQARAEGLTINDDPNSNN